MKTYVAYLRVSTTKQGIDGLGMEAQESAIKAYNGNVIEKFIEVESGKRNDRPELIKAMEYCKMTGSTLIIAKLDRLARNVHFISGLMESKIEFVACDFPEANNLTLHIMAAFAEHEAKAISARTKAALAIAKSRGIKLGTDNLSCLPPEKMIAARTKGTEIVKQRADDYAQKVITVVRSLQSQGMSLRAIAKELGGLNIRTARGGAWTPTAVKNIITRSVTA